MSKILRRPMFRGGRVNSYGTGIASGLADGGRVGFYRGGGTSYLTLPEPVTSQSIGRTNAMQAPGITGISLADFFNPVSVTGQGFSEYRPGDRLRQTEREKFPMYDEFIEETEETPEGVLLASTNLEGLTIPKQINKSEGDVEAGLPTSKIEEPELKKEQVVKTPTIKETEDNEVTMTDLERALGLGDARKEYVGDALAAASKAFFEGKGFGAISDAAAVKSKAPEIKRLAGLETYKADRAQKLYETKLKAAAEQKAGTKGAFQKKLETITGQKENTPGHKIALAELKLEPTLQGQIQADTLDNNYTKPSAAVIIGYMDLYYPQSYKGTVSATDEMTGKDAGTYITDDATKIIFWDGTKATGTQSI